MILIFQIFQLHVYFARVRGQLWLEEWESFPSKLCDDLRCYGYQLLADSRSGELMRAITGEAPRMIYIPDQGHVLFHSTAALH